MDFLNPSAEYKLLAVDNVPRVSYATGGLLQKSPIVCGGIDYSLDESQECIVIGQPEMATKLLEKGVASAIVALQGISCLSDEFQMHKVPDSIERSAFFGGISN